MMVVFQTETGGTLDFSYTAVDTSIVLVSGYADTVGPDRNVHRFVGSLVSGFLHVPNLPVVALLGPGKYSLLPQVVDADGLVYFLKPEDLEIIEYPSQGGY